MKGRPLSTLWKKLCGEPDVGSCFHIPPCSSWLSGCLPVCSLPDDLNIQEKNSIIYIPNSCLVDKFKVILDGKLTCINSYGFSWFQVSDV